MIDPHLDLTLHVGRGSTYSERCNADIDGGNPAVDIPEEDDRFLQQRDTAEFNLLLHDDPESHLFHGATSSVASMLAICDGDGGRRLAFLSLVLRSTSIARYIPSEVASGFQDVITSVRSLRRSLLDYRLNRSLDRS